MEHKKIQVIRKAKNLRDKKDGAWEKVYVHQDLTPRQREERNKLVKILKYRLAQGRKGSCDLSWRNHEKEMLRCRDDLQCLYLNADSLIRKFDHFESWVCDINPDVVAVIKSLANKNILDSEISIPGYSLFRRDRPVDREGGGVLLYVKSFLQPAEFILDSSFPEQVWCRILDSAGKDFNLGICYRTPTTVFLDLAITMHYKTWLIHSAN